MHGKSLNGQEYQMFLCKVWRTPTDNSIIVVVFMVTFHAHVHLTQASTSHNILLSDSLCSASYSTCAAESCGEVLQDSHWSNCRCQLRQSWAWVTAVTALLRLRWLEPRDRIDLTSVSKLIKVHYADKSQSIFQNQHHSRCSTIECLSFGKMTMRSRSRVEREKKKLRIQLYK